MDRAALGAAAVSYPIELKWATALRMRGPERWLCESWADGQMIIVAPPGEGEIFAINANTGAWCEFTGWPVAAIRSFAGRLYIGTAEGVVAEAWQGGSDMGSLYVGQFVPLFSTMGAPAARKFPKLARVSYLSITDANEHIAALFDYSLDLPAPAGQSEGIASNVWGGAIWGEGRWGQSLDKQQFGAWRGVGGSGTAVSVGVQVVSEGAVPLDVEVIGIDMMVQAGDAVT